MNLHELKSHNNRGKKRIGRGGKRGTFAGRGTKGQKSRSGRRLRKAERDLIIRLPKRRGFRNKTKGVKPVSISLEQIIKKTRTLSGGNAPLTIDMNLLKQVRLVSPKFSGRVKILNDKNEVKSALILKDIETSESVKIKIEKAGGKIAAK